MCRNILHILYYKSLNQIILNQVACDRELNIYLLDGLGQNRFRLEGIGYVIEPLKKYNLYFSRWKREITIFFLFFVVVFLNFGLQWSIVLSDIFFAV